MSAKKAISSWTIMGRTLTVAVTTLVDSEKGICAIYIQMHPQNQKALEVPEYLRLLTWLWYMIYMIPPPELLQNVCIGSTLQILQGIIRNTQRTSPPAYQGASCTCSAVTWNGMLPLTAREWQKTRPVRLEAATIPRVFCFAHPPKTDTAGGSVLPQSSATKNHFF